MTRTIEATGVAVGTTTSGNTLLAERLKEAMMKAAQKACEEGITDTQEIRRRILQARDEANR